MRYLLLLGFFSCLLLEGSDKVSDKKNGRGCHGMEPLYELADRGVSTKNKSDGGIRLLPEDQMLQFFHIKEDDQGWEEIIVQHPFDPDSTIGKGFMITHPELVKALTIRKFKTDDNSSIIRKNREQHS